MHGCEHAEDLGVTVVGYRKRFVLSYLSHRLLKAKQYPLTCALAAEQFDEVTVEVTRRLGDDFRRVHQVRSLLLSDANGAVESLVLISRDVTERLSAEDPVNAPLQLAYADGFDHVSRRVTARLNTGRSGEWSWRSATK